MSKPRPPALDPSEIEPRTKSLYPPPYDAVTIGRAKRSVTDALKLTQFGVNVTDLAPGASSALRHWHTREDEFIYVLEGEVTLETDEGKQTLRRGQCAGFPAGVPNGHRLINETSNMAVVLEVGTRDNADEANYPDVDLHVARDGYTAKPVFTKKDGTPFES